jgi:hypothetical protein
MDDWGDNTLDEISFHSTALTATNITDLYNAVSAGQTSTVTAPFTGTGSLTAATSRRTTATATASFTGTGTFTATATPAGAIIDSITRIRGAATPDPAITLIVGAITGLEPFTDATIIPTIAGTLDLTDIAYTITQTVGPPVHITGTGPWMYRTPGVPTTQTAAQLRFTITASKPGFADTATSVDHYVYPAPCMDYDTTGAARGLSIQT